MQFDLARYRLPGQLFDSLCVEPTSPVAGRWRGVASDGLVGHPSRAGGTVPATSELSTRSTSSSFGRRKQIGHKGQAHGFLGQEIRTGCPRSAAPSATRNASVTRSGSSNPVARFRITLVFLRTPGSGTGDRAAPHRCRRQDRRPPIPDAVSEMLSTPCRALRSSRHCENLREGRRPVFANPLDHLPVLPGVCPL
jgi:hypothetical protein